MTKLRELKKKYEQSQLAELAAWGVLRGHYANALSLNSEVGYSDYKDASSAWREAHRTFMEDGAYYRAELSRFQSFNMKVVYWATVVITVVLTFGMLIT
jgi:hypothetical protein